MTDSKKIDNGGPAFPQSSPGYDWNWNDVQVNGMSLRDWFAGKVLACGDWSNSDVRKISDEDLVAMCQQVYRIADAMIAARKAGDA